MEEHEVIIEEQQPDPWYKGPVKIMVALFLLLLMILWVVPESSIKLDPSPSYIPTIPETFPAGNESFLDSKPNNNFQDSITADDLIKQTANAIIAKSGCQDSRVCNAKAMFFYVQKNIQYVNDPVDREYLSDAIATLNKPTGDCDDQTILLANLLNAVGIQTRYVFIPGHVYVEANLPEALKKYKITEDWVTLDATCEYCAFGEIPYQNINKDKRYIE